MNFGYEADRMIINDLSISVKAGQKVAIVGPTGAGKTTLVNLLLHYVLRYHWRKNREKIF